MSCIGKGVDDLSPLDEPKYITNAKKCAMSKAVTLEKL